jgi:hypothetical protein
MSENDSERFAVAGGDGPAYFPGGGLTAMSPEERKEAPDDNKIWCTSSGSHLVQVRLGQRERSILLGINGEAWTPFPEWNERKNRPTLSRAINYLIRLELIESDYDYAPGKRSTTRRVKDGVGQNYNIYYDRTRKLRLTRLGARVVEHYREALTHGYGIRWSRLAPELGTVHLMTCQRTGERRLQIKLPDNVATEDMRGVVAYAKAVLNDMDRCLEEDGFSWGPKTTSADW